MFFFFFFFNDTATTEIYTVSYTLSLHDALPILSATGLGWSPPANSSRAPSGGNMMRGRSAGSRKPAPALKRCNGGGSLLFTAKIVPFGDCGNGTGVKPERAKASNKIGAAD